MFRSIAVLSVAVVASAAQAMGQNPDISIALTLTALIAVGAVTHHNWAETYGVGQNGTGVDVGFVTQLVL